MSSSNSEPKLLSSEELASQIGLPTSIAHTSLVGYRSVGIGLFGAAMRWVGMPLEKIALFMNSTQVTGQNQFRQAVQLTFQEGFFAPYRVVGPASLTAWFMQYSVMGVAFQFFDRTLSSLLDVRPMYYGKELMEPPPQNQEDVSTSQRLKGSIKNVLSPILASGLESFVSNRAEVQRYFGPKEFASLEARLAYNPLRRAAGPVRARTCWFLLALVKVVSLIFGFPGVFCKCNSECYYVSNQLPPYTRHLQAILSTGTKKQK